MMMPQKKVCLLDMDGVLFNFVQGAIDVLETHLGHKGVTHDDITGWNIHEKFNISQKEFWEHIDREGPSFWYELELYPWAHELHEMLLEAFDGEVYFCTTPSRSVHSVTGKRQALIKHFPDHDYQFIFTGHKHLLSRSYTVLVDDSWNNCSKFDNAGKGRPILFAQPWNYKAPGLTHERRIRNVKKDLHIIL